RHRAWYPARHRRRRRRCHRGPRHPSLAPSGGAEDAVPSRGADTERYQRNVTVCGFRFLTMSSLIELPVDSRITRMSSPGLPTGDAPALMITSPGRRPDSFAGVPSPTLTTKIPGDVTPT